MGKPLSSDLYLRISSQFTWELVRATCYRAKAGLRARLSMGGSQAYLLLSSLPSSLTLLLCSSLHTVLNRMVCDAKMIKHLKTFNLKKIGGELFSVWSECLPTRATYSCAGDSLKPHLVCGTGTSSVLVCSTARLCWTDTGMVLFQICLPSACSITQQGKKKTWTWSSCAKAKGRLLTFQNGPQNLEAILLGELCLYFVGNSSALWFPKQHSGCHLLLLWLCLPWSLGLGRAA